MNKKFSTLLAGVALLSAMSANAQTTPAQNVLPTAQSETLGDCVKILIFAS